MLALTTKLSMSGAKTLPNRIASIMPSGNAGFTTRIRTHITPIRPPYHQRPALVMAPETGSVTMKTKPNM